MLFKSAAAAAAFAGLTAASPVDAAATPASKATSSSIVQPFWAAKYTATSAADIAAAAATAMVSSSTSHVKGAAFDRLAIIMMENMDYEDTENEPHFAHYAKQGIKLSNYYGVTHPSEPNYVAAIMGDHFGMQNDDMNFVDESVFTIVDSLEHGGISWATYQEGKPFAGYGGYTSPNLKSNKTEYYRKHDGIQIANSVANDPVRISFDKNISMEFPHMSSFHQDLANNMLPQWMFITPNITSDGHDTNATVAGQWLHNFIEPLLNDKRFMDRTLVFLCWDENKSLAKRNQILGVLFGDAVPKHLRGTVDNSFYNQYSMLSTVQANWNLHHLGRFDAAANVFKMVGSHTGDKIRKWESNHGVMPLFNDSYAGPFNTLKPTKEYPAPNIHLKTRTGRTILPQIAAAWKGKKGRKVKTYYKDTVEIPTGATPPRGWGV